MVPVKPLVGKSFRIKDIKKMKWKTHGMMGTLADWIMDGRSLGCLVNGKLTSLAQHQILPNRNTTNCQKEQVPPDATHLKNNNNRLLIHIRRNSSSRDNIITFTLFVVIIITRIGYRKQWNPKCSRGLSKSDVNISINGNKPTSIALSPDCCGFC